MQSDFDRIKEAIIDYMFTEYLIVPFVNLNSYVKYIILFDDISYVLKMQKGTLTYDHTNNIIHKSINIKISNDEDKKYLVLSNYRSVDDFINDIKKEINNIMVENSNE